MNANRLNVMGMMLVAAAATAVAQSGCQKPPAAVETPPPKVNVAKPEVRAFVDYDRYNGWLQAVETVDVRARVRGLVERAGLRIAGLGYWNSLLFPVMLVHRLVTRRPSESDVRGFPHWEDRLLYGTAAFERRLSGVGFHLPFGGSVWLQAVKQ